MPPLHLIPLHLNFFFHYLFFSQVVLLDSGLEVVEHLFGFLESVGEDVGEGFDVVFIKREDRDLCQLFFGEEIFYFVYGIF